MLFALGVASTALEVLNTLTSSAKSLAQSNASSQGSADPFRVSRPAPASVKSTQVTTGFNASPQISPATMDALLAAQDRSPTTSTPTSNGPNSASSINADISSHKPMSHGAFGSATQSYNAAEQMIQQQMQAMVLTA